MPKKAEEATIGAKAIELFSMPEKPPEVSFGFTRGTTPKIINRIEINVIVAKE